MKKLLLLLIFVMSIIPFVNGLNFVTGDSETLFGTCILANGSLGGDNMSLTAYYPNTTVFLNAVQMSEYSTGQFNYSFIVPNLTGTYPYSMTCWDGGSYSQSSDEFIVLNVNARDYLDVDNNITIESEGIAIALSITIIVFIILLLWVGLIGKQYLTTNETFQKFIKFITVSFSLFLVPVIFAILVKLTEETTYGSLIDTIYTFSIYFTGFTLMVYIILNLWQFIPMLGRLIGKILRSF